MFPSYLRSSRRLASRVVLLSLVVPALLSPSLQGQAQAPVHTVVAPMQAQLVRSLDGATLRKGDEIGAKLTRAWQGDGCELPAASLIHGTVTAVATGHNGSVTVLFQYHCVEHAPVVLTWLALLSPVAAHTEADTKPVFQGSNFHSSGFRNPGNTLANHVDMSGRQDPSMPVFPDGGAETAEQPPAALKTGQVWKLPHLALQVGDASDGGTAVRSTAGSLKVPSGAVLVLMPESLAVAHTTLTAPVTLRAATPKAIAPLPPMLKTCSPPACTTVRATGNTTHAPEPQRVIALSELNYKRLHTAEMQDLERGTALTYLSDSVLLFTYDPRALVRRRGSDRLEDWPHTVRGVLYNAEDGQVMRRLEWRVPDQRQYVWPVRDGVVVHEDDALCWMDSSGNVTRRLPLHGALLYFQSSPDGQHFLVGTIHELHSPEEHATLVHADAAGPEEQVDLEVLNAKFEVVDQGSASSRLMQPLLMNEGRMELRRRARSDQWFLRKTAWESGSVSELARFVSTCVPRLQSVENDMLLVEGCDDAHLGHWYSVFNVGGEPVLRGELGWHDFQPLVVADVGTGSFAVAVPEGGENTVRGSVFHGTDLIRERVNAYDRNGKALASVNMRYPLPSMQPVTVAPGGAQFAVLDGGDILVYALQPHDLPQVRTQVTSK